ncbi:MAG: pilus assembly protein [Solirubrobacterales bacterium]
MGFRSSQRGQASVEFLAALPLVVVIAFSGWQLVVAGHTWWKLQESARVAARARYVAEQSGDAAAGLRKGRRVAAALLASSPSRSRKVSDAKDGAVEVRARVPLVGPFRAAFGSNAGPELHATSRMRP